MVLKGKKYRAKSQGYGKRKEAKRYLKRSWRRAMKEDVRRGDAGS